MLRRLKKRGQSTGEYAIVFAIVLGAIVAVQTIVRRQLQQGFKTGSDYLVAKSHEELSSMPGANLGVATDWYASETSAAMRKSMQEQKTNSDRVVKKYDAKDDPQDTGYAYSVTNDDRASEVKAGSFSEISY